jgi:cell cycle checkpoint protein
MSEAPSSAPNLNSVTSYGEAINKQKLIVVDELPYAHTMDTQKRLQHIITTHITRRNTVPTIFIYSDTAEGKIQYDELERYVHPNILYDQSFCHILAINPPTKIKFRRVIGDIITSECTIQYMSKVRYHSAYVDELYERCNGDLRYAIATLQFEMIGDGVVGNTNGFHYGQLSKLSSRSKYPPPIQCRDLKLSPFHALGKLLYAKRQVQPANAKLNGTTTSSSPLDFDPDVVIRQSEMELGNILQFLLYHSVHFFTDMDNLEMGMSYFSDSAVLCDHQNVSGSSSTTSVSLTDIATAITGRIVAHTNKHPAPFTFRSFTAPKIYDMVRKRRDNQERIQSYSQGIRLQGSGNKLMIDEHVNASVFAVDYLPYIRAILPEHHVSTSLLDSFFSATSKTATTVSHTDNHFVAISQDVEASELWKEQEEILKLDDIIEDIGDDDGW